MSNKVEYCRCGHAKHEHKDPPVGCCVDIATNDSNILICPCVQFEALKHLEMSPMRIDKLVLLISGKIGAGKNTLTDMLCRHLGDKAYQTSFAKPLKDMCEKAFRPLCEYLNEHADFPIQEKICKSSFYENKTPVTRMLLQAVGTDIVRKVNPTYWIEQMIDLIASRPEPIIIISDWRFPDEYAGLHECYHVETLRVLRPGTQIGTHASETVLDDFTPEGGWSYRIDNDSGLSTLNQIAAVLADGLRESVMP